MKHHRIKQPAQPGSLELDHEACYRAVCQRDARFDGRFFGGVKTTGIYCRPICPARTPLSKNMIFFPTAAAAQEAASVPACAAVAAPLKINDLAWVGDRSANCRQALSILKGSIVRARRGCTIPLPSHP
jgi:AraC family transcriptional regulator of adaptative response / DNA-3-methyladenine glycosylase II